MDDDPAYDIAVTHTSEQAPDCERSLREAIQATFRRHQTPAAQISVALVNDDRMADLNELHLAQKGPTDVLAFDLRNDKQDDPHAPQLLSSVFRFVSQPLRATFSSALQSP